MRIPTDAELDRLADMLGLPPLDETPDPAVTERCKAAVRAAFDAALAGSREHVRDGSCCGLPAGDI